MKSILKLICVAIAIQLAACGMPGENDPRVSKNTYITYANQYGYAKVVIPNINPDSFVDVEVWQALQDQDGNDYQYVAVTEVHLWPSGHIMARTEPQAKVLFIVSSGQLEQ